MTSFWEKIDPLDQKIILRVQKIRSPLWNVIFKILTYSAIGPVWWAVSMTLYGLNFSGVHFVDQQEKVLRAFYSPLLTWIVGVVLKKKIARTRPSEEITGYKRLIVSPLCGSFPSTHAASTVSFFVVFLFMEHPLALVIGVWALLVSFSRVYLGVHYLSDVIGGAALGVLCTLLLKLLGWL